MPEITLIIDAPSRYIVGYSLSYSESGMAVLSALRYAWARHGVNAVHYSDNGRGEKNVMLSDEVVGVFARLGITHLTGIPGNPQGRGIIERLMKEVPKRVAQSFETYHGKDADPDTVRKRLQAKIAHNKANMDGKVTGEMTPLQRKGAEITPTMSELKMVVEALIDEYNNVRKHSSIGMTPAQKRAELDKKHGSERVWLSELDLRELAVAVVERTVSRGWVRHDNRFYFSQALVDWHGKKVYLYANDDSVAEMAVRDKDGVYICTAILEGNSTPAIPLDLLEQADHRRLDRAIKRKENQVKQLEQQRHGKAIIDAKEQLLELTGEVIDGHWVEVKDDDDNGFEFYAELDWDDRQKAI
ncbi:Integrase core domain [Moraxella lacunata]|uniref:Integrase core domain n=2 Tax=Moraxella lacunata TaxID=477 RepID=A0A378TT36_MORLA|nr:Integrase core domain [Moraxella lacunata]